MYSIANIELFVAKMVEFQNHRVGLSAVGTRMILEVSDKEQGALLKDLPVAIHRLVHIALLVLGVVPLLVRGTARTAIRLSQTLVLIPPCEILIVLLKPASAAPSHASTVEEGCDRNGAYVWFAAN